MVEKNYRHSFYKNNTWLQQSRAILPEIWYIREFITEERNHIVIKQIGTLL